MEPFIRLIAGTFGLRPETRLLKARDYQALVDARRLLADAQQQARELLAEAGQEYEQQKQRGYEDGMNQARLETAERLIQAAEHSVNYLAHLENKVATLVMTAVRKILGEFDDTELTLRVVHRALQVVRNQPQVTIRVRPDQELALRSRLGERLLAGYSEIGAIEVIADPRLGPGGCILETEIGVVDASIEVQLQALERALKSRIASLE